MYKASIGIELHGWHTLGKGWPFACVTPSRRIASSPGTLKKELFALSHKRVAASDPP